MQHRAQFSREQVDSVAGNDSGDRMRVFAGLLFEIHYIAVDDKNSLKIIDQIITHQLTKVDVQAFTVVQL